MARSWFGGTHLDVVVRPYRFGGHSLAELASGRKVTFHDAETGGGQVTDLLDAEGSPTGFITSDADGFLPRFQGPDSVTTLYADAGFGRRFLMVTTDGAIDLSTQLSSRIPTSEKGAPNGVATLDSAGRLVEAVDAATIDTGTLDAARLPATYVKDGEGAYGVVHGAVASTPRPNTTSLVVWVGTVDPANAEADDLVFLPEAATAFATAERTAGDVDITTTSPSWADVDTALDLTVNCATGDKVLFYANGKWKGGQTTHGHLRIESVNPSTLLGAPNGVIGWVGPSGNEVGFSGAWAYTVQAADIASGSATFRLVAQSGNGTTRTLKASTDDPLQWSAQVIK